MGKGEGEWHEEGMGWYVSGMGQCGEGMGGAGGERMSWCGGRG